MRKTLLLSTLAVTVTAVALAGYALAALGRLSVIVDELSGQSDDDGDDETERDADQADESSHTVEPNLSHGYVPGI